MKINFIQIDSSFVITEDWHFTVSNYHLTNPIKNAFCTNLQDADKNWLCVAKAGTKFKLKKINLKGRYGSESYFYLSTKISGKDSRLCVSKSQFNKIEIDRQIELDKDFTYSIVSSGSCDKYYIPYSINETNLNPSRTSFRYSLHYGSVYSVVNGRHFDESANVKFTKIQFANKSNLSVEHSSNDFDDMKNKFESIKKNSEYTCLYKTKTELLKGIYSHQSKYLDIISASELIDRHTNNFVKSPEIDSYLKQTGMYNLSDKETIGLVSLVNKLESEGKLYIKKGKK